VFINELITNVVANYLKNQIVLRNGRVHPVALLVAKLTYQSGQGLKGSLTWQVSKQIVDALEEAFYIAFGNINGTGKKILHAVDCSGSMSSPACAIPQLSACQAVGTLLMEAIKREHKYHETLLQNGENSKFVQDVVLFKNTLSEVKISHTDKLDNVIKKIQDNNFGSTDCALPMIHALNKYKQSKGKDGVYDAFIVYTDNETYYGKIHPSEALDEYRKFTGINAKMVVIATTPTNNSIGFFRSGGKSPKDDSENALNIAGFDLNGPELIRNFLQGNETNLEDVDTEEYEILE
jgi:60 kDa SS-A/Ro ribonucleoprotein